MTPAKALRQLLSEADKWIPPHHSITCPAHIMDDCNCHVMAWHRAKGNMWNALMECENELPSLLFGALCAHPLYVDHAAPIDEWRISAHHIEQVILRLRQHYHDPTLIVPDDLRGVLNYLGRWAMSSAHAQAMRVHGFPEKAMELLDTLSREYGDCGFQQGTAFGPLRRGIEQVADLLGYQCEHLTTGTTLKKKNP